MTTTDQHLRDSLTTAGTRRSDALANAARAMADIEQLVPKAVDAGIPIRQIALMTGLTRPTIYKIIGPAAPAPAKTGRGRGGKPSAKRT